MRTVFEIAGWLLLVLLASMAVVTIVKLFTGGALMGQAYWWAVVQAALFVLLVDGVARLWKKWRAD